MESEQSLTPNSAVDHVRRESATPFSYRNALHALLGISDADGGHVHYARTLPPVELRYPPQPVPDQPWHLPEAWQETAPSGFDEAAARHPGPSAGRPGSAAPHHAPSEEQALALLGVPSQPGSLPAVQTVQPLEASSQAQPGVSGVATARVERPDERPQEITIAVPGISERRLHFPALAPAKQDDRPVSTAEAVEGAAREREHPTGIKSTQPAERGGLSTVERKPASASHLMAEREAGAVGRLGDNIVSSANGDVAASIEQLRRTVRELAAKVASRQARSPDEAPPQQTVQTPPRAVQRVVIIKPAAPQSGPPRAFWERSYLSRLSWRTLR